MMEADWVCPFCDGTGTIDPKKDKETRVAGEMKAAQACTHCLGTGRLDFPDTVFDEAYDRIIQDR